MEYALPQGVCYCGCETSVGPSKFFVPTHDRIAEANLLAAEYDGSIANMLVAPWSRSQEPSLPGHRSRGRRAKYAGAENVRPKLSRRTCV